MKCRKSLIIILSLLISSPVIAKEYKNVADSRLLPSPYPVYVQGTKVINNPVYGFNKVLLPTDNEYDGIPGCYVACYSHSANGVYPVSEDIYVMGQVRVKGEYVARICKPQGYEAKDISKEAFFTNLCNKRVAKCADVECWAGGDTGGWYGIQ